MSYRYRSRALLHRLHEGEFKSWLTEQGFELHALKGEYEKIRAKKLGKWLIVYDRNRGDHLTVRGEDFHIVRKFYDSRKERDRPISQAIEAPCSQD